MKTMFLKYETLLLVVCFFFSSFIINAQTSAITGTVYEKEQSKTTFSTPNGKITVYLPDDLHGGDQITGTVTAHPNGETEKVKQKNLKQLLDHTLFLTGNVLLSTLTNTPNTRPNDFASYKTIQFKVPEDQPFSLELKSPKGKTIAKTEIPTLPSIPIVATEQAQNYTISKKIITNTEPLTVLKSVPNTDLPMVILNSYGNRVKLHAITLESTSYSPRKLVYFLPAGLAGVYTVCLKFSDGKHKTIDLINIVNVDASIGKGNLSRGETTPLHIKVTGLDECPFSPIQMELVNKTPSIIQLENGNQQLLPISQSDKMESTIESLSFETTQMVIGQTPGNFIVTTKLHIPPTAYANSVKPYFDNTQNIEEFNASSNALKKDLDNFLSSNDPNTNTNNYLKRVKDKLPIINSDTELDYAKSLVINMLNPLLTMPKGNDFLNQTTHLEGLHPEFAQQKTVPQGINPIHDLAGEFNSATNLLHVNTEDKEDLLNYLGAEQMPNGNYTFTLSDGEKPVVHSDVVLRLNDTNTVYDVCNSSDSTESASNDQVETNEEVKPTGTSTKDTKTNDADTKVTTGKEEKKGIEWPEKGTDFEDKEGRKYRFFKGAECKVLYSLGNEGKFGDCQPQLGEGVRNEATGKYEYKPTGKFSKWNHQPTKRCIKGTGFCTEMMQITSTEMVYEDKDCERLIEIKTYEGYLCDD